MEYRLDDQGALDCGVRVDPQATACKWSDRREADTPLVVDAQAARLAKALQAAEEREAKKAAAEK